MGGQSREFPRSGLAASMAVQSRSSDVLPLPVPYPGAGILRGAYHLYRAMRRRLHSQGEWQAWANDAVRSLNSRYGSKQASGSIDQCSADIRLIRCLKATLLHSILLTLRRLNGGYHLLTNND